MIDQINQRPTRQLKVIRTSQDSSMFMRIKVQPIIIMRALASLLKLFLSDIVMYTRPIG